MTEELCGRLNGKLFEDAADDLVRDLFPSTHDDDDDDDEEFGDVDDPSEADGRTGTTSRRRRRPRPHARLEQFTFARKKFVWELYEHHHLKTFKANIPKRRILKTEDYTTAPYGSRLEDMPFLA